MYKFYSTALALLLGLPPVNSFAQPPNRVRGIRATVDTSRYRVIRSRRGVPVKTFFFSRCWDRPVQLDNGEQFRALAELIKAWIEEQRNEQLLERLSQLERDLALIAALMEKFDAPVQIQPLPQPTPPIASIPNIPTFPDRSPDRGPIVIYPPIISTPIGSPDVNPTPIGRPDVPATPIGRPDVPATPIGTPDVPATPIGDPGSGEATPIAPPQVDPGNVLFMTPQQIMALRARQSPWQGVPRTALRQYRWKPISKTVRRHFLRRR